MYDLIMENREPGVIASALSTGLELRKMSAAQLARDSGVDKSTISLILSDARPNTPALIVAKLARALDVSADFLVGLTQDPEPKSMELGEILMELTQVAKKLTNRRQRDLLEMARVYLEHSEQLKVDPGLLSDELMDLVKEAGGEGSRQALLDILRSDVWEDDSSEGGLLTDETDDPLDDDS